MTSSRTARRLRWALPVGVGAVAAAVAVVPGAATAGDAPVLPPRTAADLLAQLGSSDVAALSGTVVETARLGLPELPAGAGGSTGPLALATGSTTLKVWYDGPERQRIAILGALAEYDAVHSGRDLWTYSSGSHGVTHAVLPDGGKAGTARGDRPALADPGTLATPRDAAGAVLAAVDPTTAVTVDPTARVAGRPAYQLVLTPRDPATLVASVRVALDSATGTPLRVQVWGTGDRTNPALEVGFTDVSFARPDASVFDFSAPPGATVTEQQLPAGGVDRPADTADPTRRPEAAGVAPEVLGQGWTAVLRFPAGQVPSQLDQIATPVEGGRVLRTALGSVLITDDGRVLAGAVAPERLLELAR